MILRARVLLPISGPAIHDGAAQISRQRIVAVGRWRDISANSHGQAIDLGNMVMLPGLVNAHCHLDYTHMAGQFSPPKLFSDWLKLMAVTKASWSPAEYAASWSNGAQMLLRTGTTTVGDIEAVPQLLPDRWDSTPLRVFSFLEMIGITGRRTPRAIFQETVDKMVTLDHPRCRVALSPHAPYSTLPELLRLSAQAARRRQWLICTHVAESALEYAMFAQGRGEMFDWMRRSGRDMSDCGLGSPIQHLERCGLLAPNLLVAHANYLGRKDAALLGRHGASVVHCPRSHAYFRHEPFLLRRLARAGINIALGTDSLASVQKSPRQVVELNMFEELRTLADRQPGLSSRRILRMATLHGARALGLPGKIGELSPGAFADVIALPLASNPGNIYDAVVQHRGNVAASMIGGKWAIAPSV